MSINDLKHEANRGELFEVMSHWWRNGGSSKRGSLFLHLADVLDEAGFHREQGETTDDQAWEHCEDLIVTLAERLEAADQRAAEYAAVVEKVRQARGNHPVCDRHDERDIVTCGWKRAVLDIDAALSSAPADALRERDANVWDGAVNDTFRHCVEHPHWTPSDIRGRNPYREEQS